MAFRKISKFLPMLHFTLPLTCLFSKFIGFKHTGHLDLYLVSGISLMQFPPSRLGFPSGLLTHPLGLTESHLFRENLLDLHQQGHPACAAWPWLPYVKWIHFDCYTCYSPPWLESMLPTSLICFPVYPQNSVWQMASEWVSECFNV